MRAALSLLALLGGVGAALAQEQEQKLMDRIERPNMTLQNPAQGKSFYGGKSFNASGSVNVKEFNTGKAATPEFQTRNFWGAKKNSTADMKFATGPASTTGKNTIPNATKNFHTDKAAVKDLPDGGKTYATNSYSNVRETKMRGTAQGSIDREYANRKTMSIDDVRELLNKNK